MPLADAIKLRAWCQCFGFAVRVETPTTTIEVDPVGIVMRRPEERRATEAELQEVLEARDLTRLEFANAAIGLYEPISPDDLARWVRSGVRD